MDETRDFKMIVTFTVKREGAGSAPNEFDAAMDVEMALSEITFDWGASTYDVLSVSKIRATQL